MTGTVDPVERFYDDTNGRLTKVNMGYTYNGAQTDSVYLFYDGMSRLTKYTDWDTNDHTYAFDPGGRITREHDDDLGNLDYVYDAAGHVVTMTSWHGDNYVYTYDDRDQLSTITAPGNKIWDFDYNALGQHTKMTAPNGVATHYEFDSDNLFTKIEHKDGSTVLEGFHYEVDASMNVYRIKETASSQAWEYTYDSRNRLVNAIRRNAGATPEFRQSFLYDTGGNLLTKKLLPYDGKLFDDFSDGDYTAAPVWTADTGTWGVTAGADKYVQNTIGGTASKLSTSVANSDGDYWFSYCITDTSVTSARARMHLRCLNSANDAAIVVLNCTEAQLRLMDNSTWSTLATETISTESGTWYDVYVQACGQHVEVWRGLKGQALSKILSTDSCTVLTGDQVSVDTVANAQVGFDNIRYADARTTTRSFSDNFGDGNYTANPAWSTSGSWSAAGYEMATTSQANTPYAFYRTSYPNSDQQIKYSYKLDITSQSANPETILRVRHTTGNYMDVRLTPTYARIVQYKNSVPTTLATNTSAASTLGQWYDIQVICAGAHIEVWWGSSGSALQKILSTDSAGILEGTNLHFYAVNYTMLHVDNIELKASDPDTLAMEYNASNELTKAVHGATTMGYGYDTLGRMYLKGDGTYYSTQYYRYGGKPYLYTSTFPGEPSSMSWVYQANGQLHREIVGTGNNGTLFHWAGGKLIGETDSTGAFARSFVQQPFWNMGATLAEAPGSTPATAAYRYFEPDEHGTPRALRDQNKALLAKFEYMSYGEPLSTAGVSSSMGYTGMWQSSNSGNLHFPLREYDPDIARWTTRDPLGMAAGPNMHGYVNGNPSSMVDPTGGFPVFVVLVILGTEMVGGGALGLYIWYDNATMCGQPLSLSNSASALIGAAGVVTGLVGDALIALRNNPFANKIGFGMLFAGGGAALLGSATANGTIEAGVEQGSRILTPYTKKIKALCE